MRCAIFLGFLAPGTVSATEHEVAEYGHILTTCYQAAQTQEARKACLGGMSQHCMESQEGGETTLGMTFCMSAEADVWDGFLNSEYKASLEFAREMDADEAVYFPEFAKRVEALRAAQRAWIAFRDADCSLAYAQWGAGSMRNIAGAECRMRMTAERTLDLRDMRELMQ